MSSKLTTELKPENTILCLPGHTSRMGSLTWYIVAGMMILSMVLMVFDPWYGRGNGSYSLAITSILIAFLTLTTLFYDVRYFGQPRGGNLILQFLAFLPFTLFTSRLFGFPANISEHHRSVLSEIKRLGASVVSFTFGPDLIPKVIQDVLHSPTLAITLLILVSGTAIPKERYIKTGWILCAFLWPLFNVITATSHPPLIWWFGVITLCVAMYLMFHDVDAHHGDFVLVKRLRHVNDRAEYQASVRICKEAMEFGEISPDQILLIVKSIYRNIQGTSCEEIAQSLCMKLVTEHRLLVFVHGREKVFEPSQEFVTARSEFGKVMLFPRDVLILLIAIAWWISPFDLIPDFMPIVGFVDDMIILSMGATPIMRLLKGRGRRHSRLRTDSE